MAGSRALAIPRFPNYHWGTTLFESYFRSKRNRKKSALPPPTFIKVWFSSSNYKTGYVYSSNYPNRFKCPPWQVLTPISSLKNHIKSQKNHKIENSILLDSTWVDWSAPTQRSRLNHVLITEASLRYNTCYIKWSSKSYRALFNTYMRGKVTTQRYTE